MLFFIFSLLRVVFRVCTVSLKHTRDDDWTLLCHRWLVQSYGRLFVSHLQQETGAVCTHQLERDVLVLVLLDYTHINIGRFGVVYHGHQAVQKQTKGRTGDK